MLNCIPENMCDTQDPCNSYVEKLKKAIEHYETWCIDEMLEEFFGPPDE